MNRRTVIAICLLAAITAQADLLSDLMRRRVVSASVYTPTASTNLLIRWSFNSGSNTNVPDESGNGNNAIAPASYAPTLAEGYITCASTQYMATVETGIGHNLNGITATCWVWVDSFVNYAIFFGMYKASPLLAAGFQFDTTSSKKIYGNYRSGYNVLSAGACPTGQWVFVATTGADIDGTSNDTNLVVIGEAFTYRVRTNDVPTRVEAVWAAGKHPNYAPTFSGKLDECRVYNRALTSNEIVAVRNEGRP
jgi:hypothetical protein